MKKILFILLSILVLLFIIKECKLIGFCCTILSLLAPLFIGYVIAWLLKPIMLKFNKKFNIMISSFMTYFLLIVILGLISYFFIPVVIKEIKNFIPNAIDFYNNLPVKVKNSIDLNYLGTRAIAFVNNCTNNIKNIVLTIFYSIFISYFYLIGHKDVSLFISKYIPSKLANDISINLKSFVKGTLIDTLILFIMTLVSFYFVKMPYSLLFALVIAVTNIIPYVGPYIGGIPSVLVAFSVSTKVGFIVLGIIVILQFIESTFIHPIIMSKSLKISPLYIIIGLIVFSHFFGIIGMLISTPLVSIIKTSYEYFKANKKELKKVPGR